MRNIIVVILLCFLYLGCKKEMPTEKPVDEKNGENNQLTYTIYVGREKSNGIFRINSYYLHLTTLELQRPLTKFTPLLAKGDKRGVFHYTSYLKPF